MDATAPMDAKIASTGACKPQRTPFRIAPTAIIVLPSLKVFHRRGTTAAPRRQRHYLSRDHHPKRRRIPTVSVAVANTVPTIQRMSRVSKAAISVRTSAISVRTSAV